MPVDQRAAPHAVGRPLAGRRVNSRWLALRCGSAGGTAGPRRARWVNRSRPAGHWCRCDIPPVPHLRTAVRGTPAGTRLSAGAHRYRWPVTGCRLTPVRPVPRYDRRPGTRCRYRATARVEPPRPVRQDHGGPPRSPTLTMIDGPPTWRWTRTRPRAAAPRPHPRQCPDDAARRRSGAPMRAQPDADPHRAGRRRPPMSRGFGTPNRRSRPAPHAGDAGQVRQPVELGLYRLARLIPGEGNSAEGRLKVPAPHGRDLDPKPTPPGCHHDHRLSEGPSPGIVADSLPPVGGYAEQASGSPGTIATATRTT